MDAERVLNGSTYYPEHPLKTLLFQYLLPFKKFDAKIQLFFHISKFLPTILLTNFIFLTFSLHISVFFRTFALKLNLNS